MSQRNQNPIGEFIASTSEAGIALAIIVPIILFFLFALIAPVFGYYIRGNVIATYNCSENDPRVRREMLVVWIFLWTVCVLGWICIYFCMPPTDGGGFCAP